MARSKTRLAVTLTPESRASLEKLAAVSGIAASQFVAKIVHDSVPIFDAMTHAFKVARTDPSAAAASFQEVAQSALVGAAQINLELNEKATPKKKLRRRPT